MKTFFFFIFTLSKANSFFDGLTGTFEQMSQEIQQIFQENSEIDQEDLDYYAIINDVYQNKQAEVVAILDIIEQNSDDFLAFVWSKISSVLYCFIWNLKAYNHVLIANDGPSPLD